MESSPERQRTRRVACWLGLVAFLGYLPFAHGHFAGTDEMGVFLTARALYETGSWEVRAGPHRFKGRDGRTFVVSAKPQFELLATNDPLDRSNHDATPVAVDGKLFIRSNRALYCVEKK